ncbi:hypothetical protein PZH32_13940 [Adlercreutzia equolifaciens]|uniref:hypothetical protein n=1 Tax=Adlercreutzia equolifaciens TaxID=446660 RepID=UPI0023B17374|nr:hypothetical protein [Adlercreutzia equolifaciens]MDE8704053.1 hypothetical protein [Adlercreutzia equolifaciens]
MSHEGDTLRFTLEAKPTCSLRADAFVRELIAATVAAGHAADGLHPVYVMRVDQRAAE